MASRRSTATRKQPSELLESERHAKVAEAAQKLFDEVVLRRAVRTRIETPDIAKGLVQVEVLCIQEALRRNMPVALKSWPKVSIPVFKLHFEQFLLKTVRGFSPEELALLLQLLTQKGKDWIESKFFTPPALVPKIEPSETKTQGRKMDEQGDKVFIQDGVRYFPLSAAAPVAQAPASTLLDWIKKKTQFNGRPLESYHFAPANRYFLSEDSIERAANRFVKWPSEEPAGPVTIGETKDEHGYIGLTDAARTVGVDHHTMWRWATKGTAPTDEPIQVIKCPASDQYYVRGKDVSRLKKLVPRSGLRRGRRPQLAL
jgi:hypothetical protein